MIAFYPRFDRKDHNNHFPDFGKILGLMMISIWPSWRFASTP